MQSLWSTQPFRKSISKKKVNNTRNYRQDNCINNVEISETAEQNTQSENQNVNYINHNEHFSSDYGSSDGNYVAMVENFNTPPIALQNMTITIGNADCHLLLDFGSGCTIINMSLANEQGNIVKLHASTMVGEKTTRTQIFF